MQSRRGDMSRWREIEKGLGEALFRWFLCCSDGTALFLLPRQNREIWKTRLICKSSNMCQCPSHALKSWFAERTWVDESSFFWGVESGPLKHWSIVNPPWKLTNILVVDVFVSFWTPKKQECFNNTLNPKNWCFGLMFLLFQEGKFSGSSRV